MVAEFTGARPRALVDDFLDELLAPPRADVLLEELRASGELPEVVAAVDAGDLDAALEWIVSAVPAASAQERERLREVAVALFERLGPESETAAGYRRRLAAALVLRASPSHGTFLRGRPTAGSTAQLQGSSRGRTPRERSP